MATLLSRSLISALLCVMVVFAGACAKPPSGSGSIEEGGGEGY